MSVTVKQKNNVPPLRGRLRRMGSKILPCIKGQQTARPADTFNAQEVRGEDVQIVLEFLQESFDLAPMTSPADTVCKLRQKMSNTDSKIKWMEEQLMTIQDSEKTKTNRIVELENELDNLKTRNNYLTLDLKQAQEERKSATNLVSDLEHKLRDLQTDNDKNALEIEGLLQRYEEAGKVVTNLQSELDDTKQLNQFLNLQIKALDNAKENDAADWEQQKKDLESKLEISNYNSKNLEEEIENLNQTNEKLRKEAKSLESQDDGLFEELEKNMELCQDLEDKVATAAREKAEFEQETSRWENEKSELLKQLQSVQKQYQILKDQFNSVTQDGVHRHKLTSKLIVENEELCTQLEEKRQQCEINIEDPLLERGDSTLEKNPGEREKIDLKEMVEDLQYKTCKQESLIKKFRYHLSMFHKKALEEKDSMYDSMAYVDRAVVDQIYSDKELTIIKAEDLSCVSDADVDEEDDLIGKGAFGKVFLRQYQGEAVAVKVPYMSDGIRDEDDEKRLVRIKADHARTTIEAQVHLAFADHPLFPKTVGIVDFEGAPSLVLEFLGDKKTGTTHSLSQAIKFQIPDLSKSNWFDIIMDIINGMKVMHEKGLLHNDLKSNNNLLQWDPDDQRWHAFIIDMGKVSTQIIPLRHNKVPKEEIQGYKDGILFQHLAPEYILVLQPMTVQTDIYSLGKLLGRIEKVVYKSRALRDLVAEMTNVKPRLRPSWKHIERVIAKVQKRNLS